MKDEELHIVSAAICFCYTGSIAQYLEPAAPGSSPLSFSRANVEIILLVRCFAEKYDMEALVRHTSLGNMFGVDTIDSWIDYALAEIESLWEHHTAPGPKVATALFRELAAIEKSKHADRSLKGFRAMIEQSHPGLVHMLCDVALDDEQQEYPWKWTCNTCRTTFGYAGEEKPARVSDTMTCPWCRT
jgi:hypothetical protein